MTKLRFRDLPIVVRMTTAASMFMAWVLIEEFVIDRHGLNRFLPYYHVGNLCPYDLAAVLLIAIFWFATNRSQHDEPKRT